MNGTAAASSFAEVPRRELRAEMVSDLASVEAEWSALCDQARAGNVFLSPEWLGPWWKHFGAGREVRAIALRDGDKLVGFLPLFRENAHAGGLPITRVAFLGDGATGCDYLDVLSAPGREAEVREAALAALGTIEWDLCDLDGFWRESPTALLFAQHRIRLGIEEVRVRVERVQHARDGAVIDGLVRVHRLGIVLLDDVVHLGKGVQVVAHIAVPAAGGGSPHSLSEQDTDETATDEDQNDK